MKVRSAAVIAAFFVASFAHSAPTQVNFAATVTFTAPGSPYEGFAAPVTGSYFFDYDPATYTVAVNPGEGSNWGGYEYLGAPYGLTSNLPGLSPAIPTGALGVEVYDNGSLLPANGIFNDSIFFGAKQNAISYVLALNGPNSTFATNVLPSATVLGGPWSTRSFVVRDRSLNVVLQANVTSIQVSLVPEPTTQLSLLFGLLAIAAFMASHGRAR